MSDTRMGFATVTERKPSATREAIAEGVHACLALAAVVLLARAQSGAFDHSPSAWVVFPISVLIWTAAAAATRWSPSSRQPWFAAWRCCVSPTLITLIAGGRGSVALLLGELAVITMGIFAVGYFASRSEAPASETVALPREVAPVQVVGPENNSTSEPKSFVLPPSASTAPVVETVVTQPEHSAVKEVIQRIDPAHEEVALHLGTPHNESEVPLFAEGSTETESWSRRELEGEVLIEAVVLARFVEGSKLAVLHLPFVPPLPELPQIECEPLDSGCDVTIATESAYRHGAKLNVTRRSAGPAESVPIGIVIYTSVEEEIES